MKKHALVVLVAAVGFVIAAPATAGASAGKPATAHIAKKCKKKHGKKRCKKSIRAPVVTPPPAPLALTDAEVISRVTQKALDYCSAAGSSCLDYGYYYDPDPAHAACDAKSTYSWTCYGYNVRTSSYFVNALTCDFREVVERSGQDGITSHQDLTFGGAPWGTGWECYG